MHHFKIQLNNSGIEFDNDYGCNHRKGWSVFIDGSFVCELEKFHVAVSKVISGALRRWHEKRQEFLTEETDV